MFFEGHTKNQWGCEPAELPAYIATRMPIRFDYNDNYYHSKHQGIPVNGYTDLVEGIMDHSEIRVELNVQVKPAEIKGFDHIILERTYRHLLWMPDWKTRIPDGLLGT